MPANRPVDSKLTCPVFVAHDLSGSSHPRNFICS
jgi:hypothetical protein